MKVLFYKSRYVLVPLALLWGVMGTIAIFFLTRQSEDAAKEFTSLRIIDSIELLRNAQEDMRCVLATYENGALAKCRALGLALEQSKGRKDQSRFMDQVAKLLDIEEYDVVNEQGIVEMSNDSTAVGYDMHSSEQSKAFLPGIGNPDFVLIQPPQPRGFDGKVIQYIGIGRRDQKGVLQVAYFPKNYQDFVLALSLDRRMQAMRIGEKGFILVARGGKIIAAEDRSVLNKTLAELKIPTATDPGDFFEVKLHGKHYIATYETMDDVMLIGMIPQFEVFRIVQNCIYVIILVIISGIVALWIILYSNRAHAPAKPFLHRNRK